MQRCNMAMIKLKVIRYWYIPPLVLCSQPTRAHRMKHPLAALHPKPSCIEQQFV
jgi:hypothetical protein